MSNLLIQREKKSFASHSWSGEVCVCVCVCARVCVMCMCVRIYVLVCMHIHRERVHTRTWFHTKFFTDKKYVIGYPRESIASPLH